MTETVEERLHAAIAEMPHGVWTEWHPIMSEAAAELTRLRAEVADLQAAVKAKNAMFEKWHTRAAEEHARAERAESALATAREAEEKMRERCAAVADAIVSSCEPVRVASALDTALSETGRSTIFYEIGERERTATMLAERIRALPLTTQQQA